MSKEQLELEIKKKNCQHSIKYLSVNLTKYVQDFYDEN